MSAAWASPNSSVPDRPIIDAHVHTYPSREIGRQAMMGSGRTDYGGTPDELLALMGRGGIEKAVMVNMTPIVDMFDAAAAKLPADLSASQRADAEAGALLNIDVLDHIVLARNGFVSLRERNLGFPEE